MESIKTIFYHSFDVLVLLSSVLLFVWTIEKITDNKKNDEKKG
jgi:hypothetical protein